MRIVCYGDSNTFGYDPRSYFGGRYGADCRWVDLLAENTGWEVRNNGMNGREILRREIVIPKSTDLLIIMLGTNDLLQDASFDTAAERMEHFLKELPLIKEKILLIAPPPMQLGEWVSNRNLIDASIQLAKCYQELAARLGVRFANAGEWDVAISHDGVHFTEEGHKAFAEGICRYLKKEYE